jgi:hypothetical protein
MPSRERNIGFPTFSPQRTSAEKSENGFLNAARGSLFYSTIEKRSFRPCKCLHLIGESIPSLDAMK